MSKRLEQLIRLANDELLNKGNLQSIDALFASDYVAHAGGKHHTGHAFIKRWMKQLRIALPELRVVSIDILLAKGDTIAWQRTLSGIHKAALKRIPPSNRKVQWTDMHVTRFDGDKIAEEWTVSDLAAQLMLKLPSK